MKSSKADEIELVNITDGISAPEKKREKRKNVHYHQLFRFASKLDILMIIVGFVCAAGGIIS